jgi:hypothetical protein
MMLLNRTLNFGHSFSFGQKRGLNVINYTGSGFNSDALVGFHAGGLLQLGVGGHLLAHVV